MPKQEYNQKTSLPTPQEIFSLGDLLASSISFQSQKNILLDFVERNYAVDAFIILRPSLKTKSTLNTTHHFPFDVDNYFCQKLPGNHQLVEFENRYFALLKLVYGEDHFGLFVVQDDKSFSESILHSLEQVTRISSFTLYSTIQKQLYDWRDKQLALVRSVSEKISQIKNLSQLAEQITRLVQETFNYYYVAVFLLDEDSKKLKFKASASSVESQRPEFEKEDHPGFSLGEHMIGYVAETGHGMVANNVNEEPRYKEVDSLAETKSEVVFPLKVESRIFGVFDVQSDELNAFDEDDLLVLNALANSISLAVESVNLYQGIQTRATQLSIVSEVSRAITFILDIDVLLQRIVALIHDRFNFPFVHLYTLDPVQERLNFKAGSGSRTPMYEKAAASFDLKSPIGILPWVARNGETKRINDVSVEPLFLESPFSSEISGSEMTIPLSFASDILGVLDLQSDQTDAFSAEDQQLIETLADNIAIAIRNARLYRSEKWRRQVAESMRDVAGLLSENTAVIDVLGTILDQLHLNLPCDVSGIWLFKDGESEDLPIESRELFLAAYKTDENYPSEELGKITFLPDDWVKEALRQKTPTIREPEDSKGPIAQIFNLSSDYSSIAAPLHIGDDILGMLTMVHHLPGRYGSESRNITSAFASYAAIAIKNTRLYASSQEQAWISTILLQVAQATQSLTNIDELVATIVRLTPMVVGVKGCGLFLREPESGIFSLYALYGIGDSKDEFDLEKPIPVVNAPILDELVALQEPLYVHNPKEDFNLPDSYTTQMEKDTLILLPLISRNEVLGGFMLANESDGSARYAQLEVFSEERLRIIQGIIQQTAIAVENIRLLEEKQEEAYVSTVLLQASQAVVSSEDLHDTLDSIVQIMPILVGIESTVIYIWNEDQGNFKPAHAVTKGTADLADILGEIYQPGDFPMLEAVFRNNHPIVYPFTEAVLPPEDWDLVLPDEGQIDTMSIVKSRYPLLMGFPLSMQDEVFGVLLASDTNLSINRERRFELIWGMAQQASLAIQNDIINKEMFERQRLDREFQLAREIQQTFLPDQVPEIPGWQIDVRWETARQVGGDFYDYFLLSDDQLGFLIADVSDKGLAASLYMAVTRTLIRAAAPENKSPARTLERVNDLLLANSQDGLFVTVFYGVLSLSAGTLTYTIAGHNPPMISRYQSQEVEILGKGGIALGALPDIHLEEENTVLQPGDCLVLYTDGVTETFNANEDMYGDTRLKNTIEKSIGKGAQTLIEELETDLNSFRGNIPLSDDTTILAICKKLLLADNNRDPGTSQDAVNGTTK